MAEANDEPAADPIPPRKRIKHGRSSRRRKAKLRAIQEAEEHIWNAETAPAPTPTPAPTATATDTDTTQTPLFGSQRPSDRDRVWPGVLERRSSAWNRKDEEHLIGQLGYIPGNALAVAARSSQYPSFPIEGDVPLVLKLYPLAIREAFAGGKSGRKFKSRKRGKTKEKDNNNSKSNNDGDDEQGGEKGTRKGDETPLLEPFPTMYWLTHPLLRTLVSKLELGDDYNATKMERRLEEDDEAFKSMEKAHRVYGEVRWNLLTPSDVQLMKQRRWEGALCSERGVAGIRNRKAVKCLHAHLAHFLSGDDGHKHNILGKWVYDQVNELIIQRQQQQQQQQQDLSSE